ncbi:MAG: MFS transporter, partial [Proteobacteria bacterium]|nr:MFS transporter [Pseudomonadota bacterium]
VVNLGLGFRGPPGFYRALLASGDNDARGSAIVILATFTITAAGTAALAPFITLGLLPLAAMASAICIASVATLLLLPRLAD